MVWNDYLPEKSLLVVSGGCVGGWQTKFNVSPGPGLWALVLGPFGPDLGPDLGPGPELDNRKTINKKIPEAFFIVKLRVLESFQTSERTLR